MNEVRTKNDRINNFLKEHEIWSLQKYYIIYYVKNFVVLKTPNENVRIYILGKNAYIEQAPIFPIFTFEEIKQALEFREFIK